jgi:hypothetical protein
MVSVLHCLGIDADCMLDEKFTAPFQIKAALLALEYNRQIENFDLLLKALDNWYIAMEELLRQTFQSGYGYTGDLHFRQSGLRQQSRSQRN